MPNFRKVVGALNRRGGGARIRPLVDQQADKREAINKKLAAYREKINANG